MTILIADSAELKTILGGVQKSLNFATIESYLETAQEKYLVPAIGPEQLEQIALGAVTEADEKLLGKLKKSLAFYGLLEAMPFLNLAIGDLGLHETSTQQTSPARQWNYNNLEAAASNNADAYLDLSLAFLEKNGDLFPIWKQSAAYTVSKELFVNDTETLGKFLSIGNSRRAFLLLRNYIARAEFVYIRPALGADFFDELKEAQLDTPSEAQAQAIKRLKGAIAHLALYEAIPEISLQITGAGIRVINENDGIRSRMQARPADVAILRESQLATGNMYLAEAKKYLDKNAQSLYPTYYASEAYTGPNESNETPSVLPDNCDSPAFRV